MSMLFATTYPERISSLILIGSYARAMPDDEDYEDMEKDADEWLVEIEESWGKPILIDDLAPSVAKDEKFLLWHAKFFRSSASKSDVVKIHKMGMSVDIRSILKSINTPTLVLYATYDQTCSIEKGRYLAQEIPNAKLVELDTSDHLPYVGCPGEIVREVQRFLGDDRKVQIAGRILTTVLFTDIVDSTQRAASMGDVAWSDLLEAHHQAVRQELEIFRGHEVKTTGDGFHATCDGPARAVQCASAMLESTRRLGLDLRIGIHTGECEKRGESLEGVAIHIAARVSAMASGGDILVSRTVKDLATGSGIEFLDIGTHSLKGIPDTYQLFKVAAA